MNAKPAEEAHDDEQEPRTVSVTLRVGDIHTEVGTLNDVTEETWRPKLAELLREIAATLADET